MPFLPFQTCSMLSFCRSLPGLTPSAYQLFHIFLALSGPQSKQPSKKMCIKIKSMTYFFIYKIMIPLNILFSNGTPLVHMKQCPAWSRLLQTSDPLILCSSVCPDTTLYILLYYTYLMTLKLFLFSCPTE